MLDDLIVFVPRVFISSLFLQVLKLEATLGWDFRFTITALLKLHLLFDPILVVHRCRHLSTMVCVGSDITQWKDDMHQVWLPNAR